MYKFVFKLDYSQNAAFMLYLLERFSQAISNF